MPAERLLPTQEAEDLIALVKEIARDELKPHAADAEENEKFPRDAFRLLGRSGLLGLPYPEEFGGGEQPYEVYLQALEEVASAWMTVAVGLSVHVMSCYGLATFGTREQQDRWLPEMLEGELLGGYALSEVQAGSDPAAMSTRAVRKGDEYVVNGTKAWITHAGAADFYTLMARTSPDAGRGISCFLAPGDADGITAATPERKMGLTGSITAQLAFDDVHFGTDRLIGNEGDGLKIALSALDSGRLGIAATKKLGGAVVRNRAKRLIREVFRRNKIAGGFDVVVVPKRELLDATLAALEVDYRNNLRRAGVAPRV